MSVKLNNLISAVFLVMFAVCGGDEKVRGWRGMIPKLQSTAAAKLSPRRHCFEGHEQSFLAAAICV